MTALGFTGMLMKVPDMFRFATCQMVEKSQACLNPVLPDLFLLVSFSKKKPPLLNGTIKGLTFISGLLERCSTVARSR